MPRTLWPNLRDHGKTCDDRVLRILGHLQSAHGWSYVTEASLRRMFCEDVGHMPGVGTIPQALDRLAGQGLLHQVWLLKGGVLPDGQVASAGVRLIRVAMSRAERGAFMGRWRKGREKSTGRVNHRQLFTLLSAKRAVPKPAPDTSVADFQRRRDEALTELEAFAREMDEASYPPPG